MKKTVKNLLLFILAIGISASLFHASVSANTITALRTKTLTVTRNRFVSDSLNGVSAIYRKGGNDGSNRTYSCAAYVKKYYKKVYKKNVNNLFYNRTPHAYGDSFIKVTTPQVGDIVAMNTNHRTTHWAIVKQVNSNRTITLIEQNWKWRRNGKTYTKINRKVKLSKVRLYRLRSQKNAAPQNVIVSGEASIFNN